MLGRNTATDLYIVLTNLGFSYIFPKLGLLCVLESELPSQKHFSSLIFPNISKTYPPTYAVLVFSFFFYVVVSVVFYSVTMF